jgi:hypothetical protein
VTRKTWWLLILGVVIVLGLFLATRAFAQEKSAEPVLTEVQTLKLQNFALQAQTIQTQMALLQQAMRQVDQDREALIQGIEKEHPGWLVNRQTLKWERAPQPAPAQKK